MKKKIAFVSAFILLLALTGYGTYAYLTARGTAHNVITVGNVKIKLIELNEEPDSFKVMPADEEHQAVIVENTGANDCFVRVKLEVAFESAANIPLTSKENIVFAFDKQYWIQDEEGFWRYAKKLAPGDKTSNLLTGILFDASMGNEYQNAVFHISVSAQAVQAANNSYDSEPDSILCVKGWPKEETGKPSDAPAT